MELNLFDLGVILTIGLSALLSFFRGFVREILSLGGWLVASIVTLRFIEPVAGWVKPQVKSEVIASGIAAVGLFFVTLIALSILANGIVKFLKPGDKMGLLDNLAGLAFGAARGALIVGIAFFILTVVMTEKNYPDVVKNAYTRPYAAQMAKWITALTPDYLNKVTKRSKEESSDVEDTAKDGLKAMQKHLERSREKAEEKLQDELDKVDKKIEDDMPSIEDLQRRIKEENEKRDVR